MACTSREWDTCDVEKLGCEGCFYENKSTEKQTIRNLARAVIFMGTNENLTVEEVIEEFSKNEDLQDDFFQRWQKAQWKESHLKDEVIDLMAEDYYNDYLKRRTFRLSL